MKQRHDINSLCGLHVRSTRDRADAVCVHCERAAVNNANALADVVRKVPTAGRPKRVGQTDGQRAAHQAMLPVPGEREYRRAQALPRRPRSSV